jgi:hypothetical protein
LLGQGGPGRELRKTGVSSGTGRFSSGNLNTAQATNVTTTTTTGSTAVAKDANTWETSADRVISVTLHGSRGSAGYSVSTDATATATSDESIRAKFKNRCGTTTTTGT